MIDVNDYPVVPVELTSDSDPAPVKKETEAPSPVDPPEPKTEADPTPEVKSEEILFETPDGRKVDAATLQREWKDNFLPDYTRKSQRIADIDRGKDLNKPDEVVPEWKKPDYIPKDYAEVIEIATAEAERRQEARVEAERSRITAIQTEVDGQLIEVKKSDPKLDENALFQHANKYGFTDLKAAHANMVDMRKVVIDTEKRVVKNVKEREADPVAGGSQGATSPDDAYDPTQMSQFANAQEYLARVKGGK